MYEDFGILGLCASALSSRRRKTTAQKIDIVAMRRKLACGIARFRKLQATYTPSSYGQDNKLNAGSLPQAQCRYLWGVAPQPQYIYIPSEGPPGTVDGDSGGRRSLK
ncbi:hypothetical protein C8F04DRAFT_1195432 [Mycena alexandri]|uniref:Uncharacterized protein n=1 Tax=Mycena alexandri TaxID=1745969 RepID=A0AAD6S628_9AGAR|nr:hypothetical protein C8F04DRAFT_1195432 [Mycena alexandri]